MLTVSSYRNLTLIRLCERSARTWKGWATKSSHARNAGDSPRSKETLSIFFFCPSPFLRLLSRVWSFACLARFAQRTKKEERLLIIGWTAWYGSFNEIGYFALHTPPPPVTTQKKQQEIIFLWNTWCKGITPKLELYQKEVCTIEADLNTIVATIFLDVGVFTQDLEALKRRGLLRQKCFSRIFLIPQFKGEL